MSNSDTGINKVLSDIGRTPGMFRRDTSMLFMALDCLEHTKESLARAVDSQIAYDEGADISDGLTDDEK